MKFQPPLEEGVLVRRYKRFLVDVTDSKGAALTLHCPNTGSMKNCLAPGQPVWYSKSSNPKRKYPHTWQLTTTPDGDVAGINTMNANGLVEEAIHGGLIPKLNRPEWVRSEVNYGAERSRIDFLVMQDGQQWFVEVKSVTLKQAGRGWFPDSVSARGTKHLRELAGMAQAGHGALLVYCVQHTGICSVSPAAHIDPEYAAAFADALEAGVEVIALKASISATEIRLTEQVPVITDSY